MKTPADRRLWAFGTAWGFAALALLTLAGTAAATSTQTDNATQGALLPRDSRDAAVFRGGLVYANYCVTCHGFNADGNGRAARLYDPRPANLRMSDKNDSYYALIIRRGGEAVGRSQFMPPWGAELTDEQTMDLVAYLRSINARPKERAKE
ncbi:c-type cytochrome [Piscinibacter sp.]|uniref:c-type cytochrome n=1 Tax=Piscinibacter sp. TaxID=1903157 RepID=UPI002BB906A9|nr:cytochrome c [Albitalea sp.]HUG26083.1 cytochrome c [Albitalea sp.]